MKYTIENPIPNPTWPFIAAQDEQTKQAMVLETILTKLDTPTEVRDIMRNLTPVLTHFKWGFGSYHMWVHRILPTGEVDPNRHAILCF